MKEINGQLDASTMKMTVVVSRFNSFFSEQLVKGAVDCFMRHGGVDAAITLVRVPGANELPQVAQAIAKQGSVDAIVCLGAVIQGATPHADLIESTTAKAFSQIALATGVPVLNGVVAAQNLEQAIERSGTKQGNKGWDTMLAAIETVAVLRALTPAKKSTK